MHLGISNPIAYQAALYIRLSKEDDSAQPSQSITNQKNLLYEFEVEHELPVYDIYVDDGFSGTSFDRPDFNRMIRNIDDHKVNMVITKDLNKIRQICSDYLKETESLSAEDQAAHNAQLQEAAEAEITALENAITLISTNLEQIYTDRLTDVLAPDDFQRFYEKVRSERDQLSHKLKNIQAQKSPLLMQRTS